MAASSKDMSCCLCTFVTLSESDLEIHIDRFHSDIFRQEYEDISTETDPDPAEEQATSAASNNNEAKKRGCKPRQSLPAATNGVKISAKRGRKSKTTNLPEQETNVTVRDLDDKEDSSRRGKKRLSGENTDLDSSYGDLKIKKIRAEDLSNLDDVNITAGLATRNSEQLAHRLIRLTEENKRLEKANSDLKAESKLNDFGNAKVSGQKAMKTISALKLSEQRLVLDNNKMYKEMMSTKASHDAIVKKFDVLRMSLKKVLKFDNDFCKNTVQDIMTSLDTDDEVYQLFNYIVSDYTESRRRHLKEFQNCNDRLKVVQEERDKLQDSVHKLVHKVKAQNDVFDKLSKSQNESKRLEKEIVQYKSDIQNIVETSKQKDNQIRDLQNDLKVLKEQSEHKHLLKISMLQDEVKLKNKTIQDLQANTDQSDVVVRLQKEMEIREKDYLISLQKYSSGLEALKSQIKVTFKEKDGEIGRLSNQLKSAEVMLNAAKRHLLKQKAELQALGGKYELTEASDLNALFNQSSSEERVEPMRIKKEIQDAAVRTEGLAEDTNMASAENVSKLQVKDLAPTENAPEAQIEELNMLTVETSFETQTVELSLTPSKNFTDAQTEDTHMTPIEDVSEELPQAENVAVVHAEDTPMTPAKDLPESQTEKLPVAGNVAVVQAEDTPMTPAKDESESQTEELPVAENVAVVQAEDTPMTLTKDLPESRTEELHAAENVSKAQSENSNVIPVENIVEAQIEDMGIAPAEEVSETRAKELTQAENIHKVQAEDMYMASDVQLSKSQAKELNPVVNIHKVQTEDMYMTPTDIESKSQTEYSAENVSEPEDKNIVSAENVSGPKTEELTPVENVAESEPHMEDTNIITPDQAPVESSDEGQTNHSYESKAENCSKLETEDLVLDEILLDAQTDNLNVTQGEAELEAQLKDGNDVLAENVAHYVNVVRTENSSETRIEENKIPRETSSQAESQKIVTEALPEDDNKCSEPEKSAVLYCSVEMQLDDSNDSEKSTSPVTTSPDCSDQDEGSEPISSEKITTDDCSRETPAANPDQGISSSASDSSSRPLLDLATSEPKCEMNPQA